MQRQLYDINPNKTNTFSIQFEEWTTLQAMLNGLPLNALEQKFIKSHEKELGKYVFIFRMYYQHQKWKLRKRFAELFSFQHSMTKKYDKQLPSFPIQKENDLNAANINQFGEFLSVFMKRVVNIAFYDDEVQHFYDILPQKFGHGVIYGQLILKKMSGGRYNQASCCISLRNTICPCARSWRTRYFTVTDNGVFYCKKKKSFEIRDMLLFCSRFKILMGNLQTDDTFGIVLISATRQLTLVAKDVSDFILFTTAVIEALKNCPFSENQRYDSFAPIRDSCQTKFYVDGEDYFNDLCVELQAAKKYVYITGWMITPYFLLKRPSELDDRKSRLDYILEQLSTKGVIIYIILYQQPEIAINNDSQFVERYLEQLGRNIKVVRHPKYLVIPFLWSHHQKIVLIDQRVAFLGGLDLCYGRWDTPDHSLTNQKGYWKGADFCNLRISDIYSPRNFLMSNLDDRTQPRMPWHDVAVQIRGNSVHDIARHFTSYWNFVHFQTKFDDRQLLSLAGRQTDRHSRSQSAPKDNRIEPMLDKRKYTTDNEELADQLIEEEYYKKYLDETVVKFLSIQFPTMHTIKQNFKKYPKKIISMIRDVVPGQEQCLIVANEDDQGKGRHKHQLLRSASTWSLGLLAKEQSIHSAYIDLIDNAERFIYIQNQFFICKQNLISERLAERINKAYREKKPFKVIILLPLLPGFEGDVREDNSAVMRIQLYWQYWTISRSSRSLLTRLKHIPKVEDYVKFYSLRQHGITRDELPLTQILYIHSKLMIIDDKKLIIGSANINDRSLIGDRDSQIGLVIQDQDIVQTTFGYSVSKQVQSFRIKLYMQHFGLSKLECQNYFDEDTWKLVQERSKTNTLIYRELFGCYPDDTMAKFQDIELVKKKSHPQRYKELKSDIKGHVVEQPLKFLEKEDLNLSAKQKEFFLPTIFFT